MERLTRRTETGGIKYTRHNIYEENIVEKLAEYEDAEEQGLLLWLPCKVGDTVYIVLDMEILKQKVKKITISSNELITFSTEIVDFHKVDIGRTVFSSEEDAEKRFSELRIC